MTLTKLRTLPVILLLGLSTTLVSSCVRYSLTTTPAPLTDGYYSIGTISSGLEDIKYQISFNRQVSNFLAQFNIYSQNIDSFYLVDSTLYAIDTSSILKNNFGNAEISQIELQVIFSVIPSNRQRQGGATLRRFTKTYSSKAYYNIDASIVQTTTNSLDAFQRALEDILFDFRIDLIDHALSVEKNIEQQSRGIKQTTDSKIETPETETPETSKGVVLE